jgi:hypothetical protein
MQHDVVALENKGHDLVAFHNLRLDKGFASFVAMEHGQNSCNGFH